MKTITITTQAEYDALPAVFTEPTQVEITGGTPFDRIAIRGSAHVEAWGQVTVSVQSTSAEIILFAFAVAVAVLRGKIRKRSKTATVVKPITMTGVAGWLDREGVPVTRQVVTLYKRVSKEWKTQEGTDRETVWAVGSAMKHPAWNPVRECGAGQFHGCSRPYFCDEFRSTAGDRYVAVAVPVNDLCATDGAAYPHKVAFRTGKVLYECDRYGAKLPAATTE